MQKNKEKLEKVINVNLELIDEKTIVIKSKEGDSFAEYIASEIIDAIGFGFDIEDALMLRDTDFMLKKIDIKAKVKGPRVGVVKGRILGKKGRTKQIIEKLAECVVALADHVVAIIGREESVNVASHAIEALIRGSPQSKVYSYLEKSRSKLKKLTEEHIEEMIEKE